MKNKYKAPKQKKAKSGAKPKWRYWMTVACVFGGVGAVFGGTLLGVFATGGFNEKQISPESITFDYNQELFNTSYSQLEVSGSNGAGEFELMLTTTTEDVTERKVALSFNDSYPVTTVGGFISNTIIQVPQYVTIGQPFSVKMLTEVLKDEQGNKILDGQGKEINWIKGGVSLLHAESTDVVYTDLKIAVDTPVYTTQTIVFDSNDEQVNPTTDPESGNEYFEILAGEKFTAKSKFIPARSEYMFADDSELNEIPEENRRKKHSFFSAFLLDTQANAITPQYIDKNNIEFVASNKIQEAPVTINAFTFKYADNEIAFQNENQAKEALEYYNTAITTLNGKGEGWKSSSAVMIGDAGIEQFLVLSRDTTTVVRGSSANIYALYNATQPNAGYFGASVISNTGRYLEGMIANIGVRFTNAAGEDVTTGTNQLIEIDSNCQAVVYDGKTYYLPNSKVANIEKAYWNVFAKSTGTEGDQDVIMEALLFTSTEGTVKVFDNEGVAVSYTKILKITDTEKAVYEWKAGIVTDYTLPYVNGKPDPKPINFRDFVDVSTTEQIKFLVHFKDEDGVAGEDYDINKILGPTSYYGQYNIEVNGQELPLYILNDHLNTLGDTGRFDLYFAVVNPNYNPGEEGYIKTMNVDKQTITCKKALYDGSIQGANINLNLADAETEKFVYVGSGDNSFTVDFVIAGDSKPAFEEKYKLNRNNFAITLYDVDGNDITNYFTYTLAPDAVLTEQFNDTNKNGIKDDGEQATGNYIITIAFTLKANQQIKTESFVAFDLDGDGLEEGEGVENAIWIDKNNDTIIQRNEIFESTILVSSASMSFEDATTEKLIWGTQYDEDEEKIVTPESFGFKDKLYVYSPLASSISATGAINNTEENAIAVTQTLKSDGSSEIKVIGYTNEVELKEKIQGTIEIKDQHGSTESLKGKWKYLSSNPEIVKIAGNGQDFSFGTASGEIVSIQIQSTDGRVTASNSCYLKLTTNGVQSMKVDTNLNNSFGDEEVLTDTTKAKIFIDGGEGKNIADVRKIVKYYLDAQATNANAYDVNLTFSLNAQTTSISDMQKIGLFGKAVLIEKVLNTANKGDINGDGLINNDDAIAYGATEIITVDNEQYFATTTAGWLTMKDVDGNTIYAVVASDATGAETVLQFSGNTSNVKSITVNKNFAVKEIISFNVTAVGVSTTLDVEIEQVAAISGNTAYTIYAGKGYDGIDDKANDTYDILINNQVEIGANKHFLFDYYFDNGYTSPLQIVSSTNGYVISQSGTGVGTITNMAGTNGSYITFNDFWAEETKTFVVEFAPDGDNYYAVKQTITFTVQRNLKVEAYSIEGSNANDLIDVKQSSNVKQYYNIYGSEADSSISSYFDYSRITEVSEELPERVFSYAVAVEDSVLQVSGDTLVRNSNSVNFATAEYVEQEIYLYCDIAGTPTKLATAKFRVRPLQDIYARVANALAPSKDAAGNTISGVTAQVQQLGGQTYVVVDIKNNAANGWSFNADSSLPAGMQISNRYAGSNVKTPLYTANSSGDYSFSTRMSALAGYNSADDMIICFENTAAGTGVYEYIYLNLIVSSVGNNPVVYANKTETNAQGGTDYVINSQTGENKITNYPSRYLEVAMMLPDQLIEKGIYDVVTAGQEYDIFVTANNGLYGDGTVVAFTGIGAEDERIVNKLIKNLPAYNASGDTKLALYDLADNLGKAYYISFKYTIKNQDFYYVIKVLPNVHALDPLYPFDGNFENLQVNGENILETSGEVELDKKFDATTLHNGEERFNVVKLDEYNYSYDANVAGMNVYVQSTGGAKIKITYNGEDYFIDMPHGEGLANFASFEKQDGTSLSMTDGAEFSVQVVEGTAIISYKSETTKYTSFNTVDSVAQVTIDDSLVLLSSSEWGKYLTAEIIKKDGKSYLSYETKDSTTPIKIVVRRTFVTTSSDLVEQIVDGFIDYTFAINDQSKDYSIRFERLTDSTLVVETLPDNFGKTEYEFSFRNGDADVAGLSTLTDVGDNIIGYNYSGLKVYLIENAVVGDTNSGTKVPDVLKVQKSDGPADIAASYVNTGANNGNFDIVLPAFIGKDTTVIFTIFTSYGHIATIKLNILSNAEIYFNTDKQKPEITELSGGKYYNIGATDDYAEGTSIVSLNGKGIAGTEVDYTLESVTATEGDKNVNHLFVNNVTNEKKFKVADLTRDHVVDVTFVLKFSGSQDGVDYTGKTFTFTKTFKLKANVVSGTAKTYEKEIIAGTDFEINMTGIDGFNINTLFEKYTDEDGDEQYKSPTSIKSVSVTTSNGAYNESESLSWADNKMKIATNYISARTFVSTTLRVTLDSEEYVDLNFSFVVVPSVEINTNYPNPTGVEGQNLEMEFVDGTSNDAYKLDSEKIVGFYTGNLLNFLVDGKSTFATANRMVINKAKNDGNIVKYSDGAETVSGINTADGLDDDIFKITLTAVSNAVVYDTSSGDELKGKAIKENTEIEKDKTLLLVHGGKTNDHAIVKFLVEYKSVTKEYVIYISKQLWTAQENYVTTNKIAGQYPESLVYTHVITDADYKDDSTIATTGHTTLYAIGFADKMPGLQEGDKIIVQATLATDTWTHENPRKLRVQYLNHENLNENSQIINGQLSFELTYTEQWLNTGYKAVWVYDGNVGDSFTFSRAQNNVTAEKIYVDKTNVDEMLEDDRMVTATIAGSAKVGEYYLAYADSPATAEVTISADVSKDTDFNIPADVLASTREGAVFTLTLNGKIKFTYDGIEYENTAQTPKTIEISRVSGQDKLVVKTASAGDSIAIKYNTNYYISNSFYIRNEDLGKKLTLDLGLPMTGKTFYGAFSVQDLKDAGITYQPYKDAECEDGTDPRQIKYATDSKALDALTKQGVFSTAPVLGNRIQLYYGEPLASYPVASGSYSFNSDFSCANDSSKKLDAIYLETRDILVKLNDDELETTVLSYDYYYMPAIDITISSQALAGAGSSITVEAHKEYKSVSELFGLIHPSTGQYLSPADAGNITIKLSAVSDAEAGRLNYKEQYEKADGFDGFKVTTDSGKQYLYILDVMNGKRAYDFSIIPQGADADGDYCMLKLEYSVDEFKQVYYVVLKIMADYDITFGGKGGQVVDIEDSNGNIVESVTSNQTAPYPIFETLLIGNEVCYQEFILAGEGGHLSVKHKNTETKNEIALSGFDVTLTPASTNNVEYNAKANVENKLASALERTGFVDDGDVYKYNYIAGTNEKIRMTSVPATVFTTQDFYLEGVDEYGFKYQLYFSLSSTGDQPKAITEGLVLQETGFFDIGLQYELLNATVPAEATGEVTLSSTKTTPVGSSDVPVINLSGIKAWLFNQNVGVTDKVVHVGAWLHQLGGCKITANETYNLLGSASLIPSGTPITIIGENYSSLIVTYKEKEYKDRDTFIYDGVKKEVTVSGLPSGGEVFLYVHNIVTIDEDGDTGTGKTGDQDPYLVAEESRKYLAVPDYRKVTIQSVGIYTEDGNTEVATIKNEGTYKPSEKGFATSESAAYSQGTSSVTVAAGRGPQQVWQIPRIDGSYYGSANKAKFVLKISLKYSAGSGSDEYCVIPVAVEIARGLAITHADNSLAIDGQAIDVAAQFNIKNGNEPDDTFQASYLNDTLEVVVKPNSVAKFTLTLVRENQIYSGIVNESNTGISAYTTKYVSISQYLGTNVQEGDKIFVSNEANIEKVYYVLGGTASGTIGQQDRVVALDDSIAPSTTTDITKSNDLIYVRVPANTTSDYKIKLSYNDGTQKEVSLGTNSTAKDVVKTVVVSDVISGDIVRGGKLNIASTISGQDVSVEYNGVQYKAESIDLTMAGYSLTIGEIVADVVYIEHMSLLQAKLYTNVTKYYIAKVEIDGGTYHYRLARDYTVTGQYNSFTPGYTGSIGQTIGSASGGDLKVWTNLIEGASGDKAFIVQQPQSFISGKFTSSAVSDAEQLRNLEYEIVRDGESAYGKATITKQGVVQITDLKVDEYIKIAVYMNVSGLDREIGTYETDGELISRVKLGEVKLALKSGLVASANAQNVVREAQSITVRDHFGTAINIDEGDSDKFYNDTLEVVVEANATATFTILGWITGAMEPNNKQVTCDNSENDYPKTFYVKISQYYSDPLLYDYYNIVNCVNVRGVYYISGNLEGVSKNLVNTTADNSSQSQFKYSEITEDKLFIDSEKEISHGNGCYVTKYYNYGLTKTGDAEKLHPVSRTYYVTPNASAVKWSGSSARNVIDDDVSLTTEQNFDFIQDVLSEMNVQYYRIKKGHSMTALEEVTDASEIAKSLRFEILSTSLEDGNVFLDLLVSSDGVNWTEYNSTMLASSNYQYKWQLSFADGCHMLSTDYINIGVFAPLSSIDRSYRGEYVVPAMDSDSAMLPLATMSLSSKNSSGSIISGGEEGEEIEVEIPAAPEAGEDPVSLTVTNGTGDAVQGYNTARQMYFAVGKIPSVSISNSWNENYEIQVGDSFTVTIETEEEGYAYFAYGATISSADNWTDYTLNPDAARYLYIYGGGTVSKTYTYQGPPFLIGGSAYIVYIDVTSREGVVYRYVYLCNPKHYGFTFFTVAQVGVHDTDNFVGDENLQEGNPIMLKNVGTGIVSGHYSESPDLEDDKFSLAANESVTVLYEEAKRLVFSQVTENTKLQVTTLNKTAEINLEKFAMASVGMDGKNTLFEVIEYGGQLYYFSYVLSDVALTPDSSKVYVGADSDYRTTVLKCIEANISKFN